MPLENIFLIFFFLFVLKVLVCRYQLLHLAAIAMCELMLGELQAAGVPVARADREKAQKGRKCWPWWAREGKRYCASVSIPAQQAQSRFRTMLLTQHWQCQS